MAANVPLVFCDTETTGLSYDKQVWDIAMIRDNPDGTVERDQFFLPVLDTDLPGYEFNEEAKKYNHWERYDLDKAVDSTPAVKRIKHMFRDRAHFIGMVPDFDANALWRLIRQVEGSRAGFPWYYQLIDVDNIALGYFIKERMQYEEEWDYLTIKERNTEGRYAGLTSLPIDTNAVANIFNITISDEDRHTAMGDAKWTREIFYAFFGEEPPAG